jgi:DNA-binding MarR family transcriptional regulator
MAANFKKVDSSVMNKMNKVQILSIIHNEKTISRADISKVTGLTPPTVTRIVEQLIHEEELVKYIGVGNSK